MFAHHELLPVLPGFVALPHWRCSRRESCSEAFAGIAVLVAFTPFQRDH